MIQVKWVDGWYDRPEDAPKQRIGTTIKFVLAPVIPLTALTEVADVLKRLTRDCMASDFNEHWESYTEAKRLLAQLEGHTKETQ